MACDRDSRLPDSTAGRRRRLHDAFLPGFRRVGGRRDAGLGDVFEDADLLIPTALAPE
ncbi:hypothetical protein LO772_16625 [Yinghuangia sp. ASG 101]|uniref:hypothetical protein n=1 Tax=Yinghuangia sp. ASG 101 TaxID=2896848 RepID=UPI001E29373C|nr:hypothetical protein [Yinghuangia sp. ASG 101]UGQ15041.1 hypothetical protein LO772_16625 [Yinghuangia sp. ASG 101]